MQTIMRKKYPIECLQMKLHDYNSRRKNECFYNLYTIEKIICKILSNQINELVINISEKYKTKGNTLIYFDEIINENKYSVPMFLIGFHGANARQADRLFFVLSEW